MDTDCAAALTLLGPLLAILGPIALYFGILCWTRPDSNIVQYLVFSRYPTDDEADPVSRFFGFTREMAGPANLLVWRLLGPLIGSVFTFVGLWITVSQIRCGFQLPEVRSILGTLSWRDPSWIFVLFAGAIGVWNGYRMQPILRELYIVLTVAFGLAASEAAAFHTGIQADRWFAMGMLALAFSGIVWYSNNRFARRTDPVAASRRRN